MIETKFDIFIQDIQDYVDRVDHSDNCVSNNNQNIADSSKLVKMFRP